LGGGGPEVSWGPWDRGKAEEQRAAAVVQHGKEKWNRSPTSTLEQTPVRGFKKQRGQAAEEQSPRFKKHELRENFLTQIRKLRETAPPVRSLNLRRMGGEEEKPKQWQRNLGRIVLPCRKNLNH